MKKCIIFFSFKIFLTKCDPFSENIQPIAVKFTAFVMLIIRGFKFKDRLLFVHSIYHVNSFAFALLV